jgi:branched-chain amino acid transport system permease protein
MRRLLLLVAALGLFVAFPAALPAWQTQMSYLVIMVVFSLTWDLLGGQMGYNSFGNVLFFGLGMYACAVVQRDVHLAYPVTLALGIAAGALVAVAAAAILGSGILGLRGHYFAIGTLGLEILAGDSPPDGASSAGAAGWFRRNIRARSAAGRRSSTISASRSPPRRS